MRESLFLIFIIFLIPVIYLQPVIRSFPCIDMGCFTWLIWSSLSSEAFGFLQEKINYFFSFFSAFYSQRFLKLFTTRKQEEILHRTSRCYFLFLLCLSASGLQELPKYQEKCFASDHSDSLDSYIFFP